MTVEVKFENGAVSIKSTGDPVATVAVLELGKALAIKKLLDTRLGLVKDA